MKTTLLVLLFAAFSAADNTIYKLCAPETVLESTCRILQGSNAVTCVRAQDSADCGMKMKRGEADFGVFSAEQLLLTNHFYPNFTIVSDLRHEDKTNEEFIFQSVVVIPKNLNLSSLNEGKFDDLKNLGFCHPGFRKSTTWSDSVLKHFEWNVYPTNCQSNMTVAENEAANLKAFFGKACRPEKWVEDDTTDQTLKERYPELCSLCDNTTECSYTNKTETHWDALNCLTSGRGGIAYVALGHVKEYFKFGDKTLSDNATNYASDYQYLCSDATVQNLTSETPCAWVRQPWDVILARKEVASDIQNNLKTWLDKSNSADEKFSSALTTAILSNDVYKVIFTDLKNPSDVLPKGRERNATKSSCGEDIRWCTVGNNETSKCNWVAEAAFMHGIEPKIECDQANSTFSCFHRIANGSTDIITIDSNFGYLARQYLNFSTVLYPVTDTSYNSKVIAVVREGATRSISSFSDISKKNVCFPEYGGIAWLSFVKAARNHSIISNSCDYTLELGNLLSGACTPGLFDRDHSLRNSSTNTTAAIALCSKCPLESNNASCSANSSNPYYGDKGAIDCLTNGAGDIAVFESRNLIDFINNNNINESNYRVLCKNGSLASRTGFNVEDSCALSVTIDSEVMGRNSDSGVKKADMVLALLKIDYWLGYDSKSNIPLFIYSSFNGTKDLLFKDTTTTLETSTTKSSPINAYMDLFRHVEMCEPSGASIVIASFTVAMISLFVTFCAF